MLAHLLEALRDGLLCEVVEADVTALHIIEQRLQPVMKQRQPLLHAGIALAGADRLIKRIVAGATAEQLDIAAAEHLLRLGAEVHLAHRHRVSFCTSLCVRWVSASKV